MARTDRVRMDTDGLAGRPLPNALDVYEPLISQLVVNLRDDRRLQSLLSEHHEMPSQSVSCQLLTLIRDTLGAQFVWVWHKRKQCAEAQDVWQPAAQSDGVGDVESEHLQGQVLSHVQETDVFSSYSYGTYQSMGDVLYIFVPLISRDHWEFMAIALPQENSEVAPKNWTGC